MKLVRIFALMLLSLSCSFSLAQSSELSEDQQQIRDKVALEITAAGDDQKAIANVVSSNLMSFPNEWQLIVDTAVATAPAHEALILRTAKITRDRMREIALTSCDRTQNATKGTPDDPCNIFSSSSNNYLAPGNTFSFNNTTTINPPTTNPGALATAVAPIVGGVDALLGPGNPVSELLLTLASPN